jgi:hypothetical protein
MNGWLGFDLANKKAELWDGGDTPFSTTNASDFGNAVVSILKHPAEAANKYLYVATVTTTQQAILKSLNAQTGAAWTVTNVQTDKQIAEGRALIAEGNFLGMYNLVKALFWGKCEGIRADYASEVKLGNSLLGVPFGEEGVLDATVKKALESQA